MAARLLCVVGALLPVAYVVRVIATHGEDTLGNDYVAWTVPVARMLAGTYAWSGYFRDTFIAGGHCMAGPVLLHALVARFAHWNAFAELYVGVGLYLLKLALLHRLIAPGLPTVRRWLLWPVLAALVFSPSQITTFTFGESVLQMGLNHLGLLLGLLGAAQLAGRWLGMAWIAGGGLLAAWSWGGGVLAWPLLLAAMALAGGWRARHYFVCLGAGAVAALPYAYFLFLAPKAAGSASVVSVLNARVILNVLGRPLAPLIGDRFGRIPEAESRAAVGLILLVAGGLLVWRRGSREARGRLAPSLLILAYSLLCAWQIGLFRNDVAPWYASTAMFFWLGLVGLAWHGLDLARPSVHGLSALRAWSALVLVLVAIWYGTSSPGQAERAFYLPSRSPAAASCLRHYRTAPTYCEGHVFQWGVGNTGWLSLMGSPLQATRSSVFAPRQEWTLQGDFVLGTVRPQGPLPISWARDRGETLGEWSSYRRLNLILPGTSTVEWTVRVPPGARGATLVTGAAVATLSAATEVVGAIALQPVDGNPETGWQGSVSEAFRPGGPWESASGVSERGWERIRVDLTPYRGRTLRIRFSGRSAEPSRFGAIAYEAPAIRVRLDEDTTEEPPGGPGQPSNTDLSPALPATSPGDVVLETASAAWSPTAAIVPEGGDRRTDGTTSWLVGHESRLEYRRALDVCTGDVTHLYLRLAAVTALEPRAVRVELGVDGGTEPRTFTIPLLGDDLPHAYTYDLELLSLGPRRRLTGLRLRPAFGAASAGQEVRLADVRFLRPGDVASRCTAR